MDIKGINNHLISEDRKQAADLLLAQDMAANGNIEDSGLFVGYNMKNDTFELVVKHSGSIRDTVERLGGIITELSFGYSIVLIDRNRISELASDIRVIYMEMPHILLFEDRVASGASCIPQTFLPPYSLSGEGVLLGIIDSGLDAYNQVFFKEDGSSRVLKVWDQTMNSSDRPGRGTIFSAEDIENGEYNSVDASGHGTSVAYIMAGPYGAFNSDILAVKLGGVNDGQFPRTTGFMKAVDFLVSEAAGLGRPIAINVSYGNNYGSHDGNELICQFMDEVAKSWKVNIICATGNEGGAGIHAHINLLSAGIDTNAPGYTGGIYGMNRNVPIVEFEIGEYEYSVNLQIWKYINDEISFELFDPSGSFVMSVDSPNRYYSANNFRSNIYAYYGAGNPFSDKNEIFIQIVGEGGYVDAGIWTIRVIGDRVINGNIDLWLPDSAATNSNTSFVRPDEYLTLTVPSTASGCIAVGAYDVSTERPASFSGRGFNSSNRGATGQAGYGRMQKPDVIAPGVRINSVTTGDRPVVVTGTSFAAPFVTAAGALLMQWGIVLGNNPYMFGEILKSALIRGARQLEGYNTPNPVTGFGRLCLYKSLIAESRK